MYICDYYHCIPFDYHHQCSAFILIAINWQLALSRTLHQSHPTRPLAVLWQKTNKHPLKPFIKYQETRRIASSRPSSEHGVKLDDALKNENKWVTPYGVCGVWQCVSKLRCEWDLHAKTPNDSRNCDTILNQGSARSRSPIRHSPALTYECTTTFNTRELYYYCYGFGHQKNTMLFGI